MNEEKQKIFCCLNHFLDKIDEHVGAKSMKLNDAVTEQEKKIIENNNKFLFRLIEVKLFLTFILCIMYSMQKTVLISCFIVYSLLSLFIFVKFNYKKNIKEKQIGSKLLSVVFIFFSLFDTLYIAYYNYYINFTLMVLINIVIILMGSLWIFYASTQLKNTVYSIILKSSLLIFSIATIILMSYLYQNISSNISSGLIFVVGVSIIFSLIATAVPYQIFLIFSYYKEEKERMNNIDNKK